MASLNDFAKPIPDAPPERPHHLFDPVEHARSRGIAYPFDFVLLENPTNRRQTALIDLGPSSRVAPLLRQDDIDAIDEPPSLAVRRAALERQRAECCKIEFGPSEQKLVPRSWVAALVNVRAGVVVGGLCPELVLVGDDNPPTLHRSLIAQRTEIDPFAAPGKQKKPRPL